MGDDPTMLRSPVPRMLPSAVDATLLSGYDYKGIGWSEPYALPRRSTDFRYSND